jgi:16S rRNA (cytosine967-C5)-methyltransferase
VSTSNPRQAAYDILLRIEKERSYADILIDRELSTGKLVGPDRGLLTELVYGTLRRQGTLDHVIRTFSSQRIDKLERSVLLLLRIGLYQMLYLDRIPVSAAVNETVKLAHQVIPRAAGFINAVLRRTDRERDTIPWPDQEKDPAGHIAAVYSHPRWLAEHWLRQMGADEARNLARAMSEPPPFTVRVNTLRIDRDRLLERLAGEGVEAVPTIFSPDGLVLHTHPQMAALPSFRDGLFTVQDEASQFAALLLAPRPGERVLDLCAAPGGKTTHCAQLMENSGTILACDVAPRKLHLIEETAARLGIATITTRQLDGCRAATSLPAEGFDKVLLDAPCSGLGVLRRNPEGKWWKSPETIAELAGVQKKLLANAAACVAPDGALVYATCSTSTEENESILNDFLSQRDDFVLEDVRLRFPDAECLFTERGTFRSWPHRHGMDGFFAARLKRINP